jgi:hypothetical protein
MLVRDLKREPEAGVIWSWRTDEDRPAAYRHNNKGPEVVVGIKGGKTDDLWHHTGPEFDPRAEARLIIQRGGMSPRGDYVGRTWLSYEEDEGCIRSFAESIDLPKEGLP